MPVKGGAVVVFGCYQTMGFGLMRALAILTAATLLSSAPALAVDRNGEFFLRGYGSATCQNYLDDRTGNNERYFYYRSWLNGYLTAYNQLTDDTFDIAPNISIDQLAEAMAKICAGDAERSFWAATTILTRSLQPKRQVVKPELQTVSAGERTMTIDRELLRRVQGALKQRGYGVGVVDGLYGRNTREALEAFQRDQQLPVTGLPDTETLARLQP